MGLIGEIFLLSKCFCFLLLLRFVFILSVMYVPWFVSFKTGKIF